MVNESSLKANDPDYLIEIQNPALNTHTGIYKTVLWIRDKSWSSGFCLVVVFKIMDRHCRFLKATPLTPSDIQDVY
jgi:hypothetical protein